MALYLLQTAGECISVWLGRGKVVMVLVYLLKVIK